MSPFGRSFEDEVVGVSLDMRSDIGRQAYIPIKK